MKEMEKLSALTQREELKAQLMQTLRANRQKKGGDETLDDDKNNSIVSMVRNGGKGRREVASRPAPNKDNPNSDVTGISKGMKTKLKEFFQGWND